MNNTTNLFFMIFLFYHSIHSFLLLFRSFVNSEEAKALQNKNVNIIIALGHSGYEMDKEIAKNCPLVDIVIGGHSNTFLYNGEQPDIEQIQGPYPTVIEQKSGKKVPVIQAYAYTKYLGELKLSVSIYFHRIQIHCKQLYQVISLVYSFC